jgi:hypothetical protein
MILDTALAFDIAAAAFGCRIEVIACDVAIKLHSKF